MTTSLIDNYGRHVSYLRLSVTDRCNLRCTYCMDEDMQFLPKAQVLSIEEMQILAKAFVALGVGKIRLTGGEPLIRQGIIGLCQNIASLPGLRELVMTTNGVLLEKYAQPLKDAGMGRLNISIDSLEPDKFKKLTRVGELQQVLDGIKASQKAGFTRTKLNAVVLKGINDDEVINLVTFALNEGLDISFIEEMPLGEIHSHQRSDTQVSSLSLREQIQQQYSLSPVQLQDSNAGPSRYHQVPGYDSRIGFISPMSDNFCTSCNRIRLTTEGRLLLCLGNEHSVCLKSVIRNNPGDDEFLKQSIINAMGIKPERHYFDPNDTQILRFMSATGG